jgi:hypothetical protein
MAQTCPKCGLLSPPEARRCDCGYDFITRETVAPSLASQGKYKGVDGWLLLLCLRLTVFSPIVTLVMLARSYGQSTQYFEQFPSLRTISVIVTALSLGFMAFSVYAGVGLWQVRQGAVETAKRYFLCELGYQVVAAVLIFTAGLPSAVNQEMFEEVVREGVREVVGVAIWYSYLNKSKRVKATYSIAVLETELPVAQRICPNCSLAYKVQDYRADVPTIYCASCGSPLPR